MALFGTAQMGVLENVMGLKIVLDDIMQLLEEMMPKHHSSNYRNMLFPPCILCVCKK